MSAVAPVDTDLHDALHRTTVPLALIAIDTMVVVDANEAALRVAGREGALDPPVRLDGLLSPDDERRAQRALGLLADGTLHSYETTRHVVRLDGTTVEGHIWVRRLERLDPTLALVVFSAHGQPGTRVDRLFGAAPGELPPPATIVMASIGLDTRIKRISAEADDLFGVPAPTLLGTPLVELVHHDDVPDVLLGLGRALDDDTGVGVRARMRHKDEFVAVRLLVTPTHGGEDTRLGLLVAPDTAVTPSADARVTDLEQHLWRIALEVQAADVLTSMHGLPDDQKVAELADLSSRQWEILARLLRGERVPGIARELYVSQSTVRNHLAAIFRKIGVHSQAELLTKLR